MSIKRNSKKIKFINPLDEIYNNELFNEYRRDVENLDKTYVELMSFSLLNKKKPIYENYFFEAVTPINSSFFELFLEAMAKGFIKNEKSFETFLKNLYNDENNVNVFKKNLKDAIQKDNEYKNLSQEQIDERTQNVIDKTKEEYKENYDRSLSDFIEAFNKLSDNEITFLYKKYLTSNEVKQINENISKFEQGQNKNLNLFINKISKLMSDRKDVNLDDKEEEEGNKQTIKLNMIYEVLEKSNALQEVYSVLRNNHIQVLTDGMNLAGEKVGVSLANAGSSNSKFAPVTGNDDRSNNIRIAQKASISYITIMSCVVFISGTYQNKEEVNEAFLLKQINKTLYSEGLSNFVMRPIKFASNMINKYITVTSFEQLLRDPGVFAKNVYKFFKSSNYTLNKVLSDAGIQIKPRDLEELLKDGLDKNNFETAKNFLISYLKQYMNKDNVKSITLEYFQNFGIKQSAGAKLREGIKSVGKALGMNKESRELEAQSNQAGQRMSGELSNASNPPTKTEV